MAFIGPEKKRRFIKPEVIPIPARPQKIEEPEPNRQPVQIPAEPEKVPA